MSARTDLDARAKWYRAWTTVRTMKDVNPLPDYMFREEYVFEYLAANRVLSRFSPDWLSYPVTVRREVLQMVDRVISELNAEEKQCLKST